MTTKEFDLSDRDKTPKSSGWGFDFHHTDPQRRVLCVLGHMLVPRSADAIPPITPEAMASVQAALKLLADLVGDREHCLFLALDPEKYIAEARAIRRVARSLTDILCVEEAP
jgi:hypothetical protein